MGCDMINRQMDKSRQCYKTWHLTHEDHCAVWLETESQNFQLKWRQTVEWSWAVQLCTLQPEMMRDCATWRKFPAILHILGVMRIFLAPNILPAFSSYCWLIDVSMVFVYRAVTVGETKNIIHLIVLCINTVLHHVKGNNVWSPAFMGKLWYIYHFPG